MTIVVKSGSLNLLELSGPVHASNGIALPVGGSKGIASKILVEITSFGETEIETCLLTGICERISSRATGCRF